jgi:hypothetical protein
MAERLKLRAEDAEDLAVVSAVLQDALVPVAEMAYLPEERRFVLVVNRFCWEHKVEGKRFERTLTGLMFDGVAAAKVRGFDIRDTGRIQEILAIRAVPGAIIFDFSAGDGLRLEVERILCHLEDLGDPWPTPWRPKHPLEAG